MDQRTPETIHVGNVRTRVFGARKETMGKQEKQMELVLCLALIAFMVYSYTREKENREERQDLMNRIMARDFQEYAVHTQPVQKFDPVSMSDEDEYWNEIEERKM